MCYSVQWLLMGQSFTYFSIDEVLTTYLNTAMLMCLAELCALILVTISDQDCS